VNDDDGTAVAAWRGESGQPAEAVVRVALEDLAAQLAPGPFVQVHRSVVLNLRSIGPVRRRDNETAEIHLEGRKEALPVSRSYLHLFHQM
jgi:DNA-binding LytR/AlgR family response regulator